MKIYDLIYGGYKYRDELKTIFPDSIIEDASDEIHEWRISLKLDSEELDYVKKIIKNGFFELSFWCQMAMYERVNIIKEAMEDLEKETTNG